MNYAGFWTRFLAALIDGIILAIVSIIITFIIGLILGGAGGAVGGSDGASAGIGIASLITNVLSIVVGWLYYALQESSDKQATIGKQALGLTVTDLNGGQISFGKATIRHFGKWLSSLILLIGYIMAAFTEKKQALHDIIAGTLVLKK
jgi:uncharacterized RDD family membrane protein YckC